MPTTTRWYYSQEFARDAAFRFLESQGETFGSFAAITRRRYRLQLEAGDSLGNESPIAWGMSQLEDDIGPNFTVVLEPPGRLAQTHVFRYSESGTGLCQEPEVTTHIPRRSPTSIKSPYTIRKLTIGPVLRRR